MRAAAARYGQQLAMHEAEKNGELYPEYTEEHRCVVMCLDGLIQAHHWRGVVAMEQRAVAVALAIQNTHSKELSTSIDVRKRNQSSPLARQGPVWGHIRHGTMKGNCLYYNFKLICTTVLFIFTHVSFRV